MAKVKYKFDPESLQFTKQDLSFKSRFIREYLGVIVAGILIAVGLIVVSTYLIVSPQNKKMRRENRMISQDLKDQIQRFNQTQRVLRDLEKRDENIHKAILESEPKDLSSDTVSSYLAFLQKSETMSPIEIARYLDNQLDTLLIGMAANEESYQNFARIFNSKFKMLDFIPSIQPVENKNIDLIVYGFGKRIDPFYKTLVNHKGMDFSVPEGTPVKATANGTVRFAGQVRGDGLVVIINHGYGFDTKYSHLDRVIASTGKKIKRGDIIAVSGNTGKSISPHLHYEVLVKGQPVNPVNFFFADLTPPQYNKMIKMSSQSGISLD
jgi:murein DD-endopeptidase MepM/ murein hydrolase activator NlpD